MTDKNKGPDVKMQDGNAPAPEVVKINGDAVVETNGNVTIVTPTERTAEASGAKAMMAEDVKPKTKKVRTGTHVITGEAVMKEVAVPFEKDYSEGRKLFPIHTSVNGSYNGRRINLVKGEEVYLSPEELAIFRNYVNGEGK